MSSLLNAQDILKVVGLVCKERGIKLAVSESVKGACVAGGTALLGGLLFGPPGIAVDSESEQSEQDNPTLIPIHPDLVEGGETNTQSESSESEDDDPSEPTSPSTQPSTSRPTSARNPNPTHPYQTRSSGPVKSAPWIFEEKRDTQTESVEPQAQRQEDLSSDGTLDTEDNEDPQTEDQLSDTVNEPNWAGRTLSGMFDLLSD
ncbi:hypothetical protein GQR58_015673 [Nymphon striatum]|nr:hypothetical protein GQR58_015673 [Nymphon striatum]